MQNVLQFVDKNIKFNSEFRGNKRVSSNRKSISTTLKQKNKQKRYQVNRVKINPNKKTQVASPSVEKHPDVAQKYKKMILHVIATSL